MNKKTNNTATAYHKAAEYLYSVFSTLLVCMMIIFTAFTFFFRLVQVSGDSMYPTLENSDRLIISNLFYSPDYGDIIAISKSDGESDAMIKRVIALPGDKVYIDFDTHIITVNGNVIQEDYEVYEPISEQYDLTYPATVPEGCVFVLGDNRNNSIDSRTASIGFIDFEEISGKALIRIFPFWKINIY